MELALYWAPAIGGLLLGGFCGNAWYAGNKTQALWFGYFGLVLLLLTVFLQIQKGISSDNPSAPSLSAIDRPWVAISNVIPVTDLVYDDKGWNGGKRWHVTLRYEMRNTGKTPALNVEILADIRPLVFLPLSHQRKRPMEEVDEFLQGVCNGRIEMLKMFGPLNPVNLYPGEPAIGGAFELNGNPQLFDAAKSSKQYAGNLVVVFCATYKFPGSDELHQTGVAYSLFRQDAKIDLGGEPVSLQELRVIPHPAVSGITS